MTRQQWRDQVIEAALEPDLPIVDPHHHLWSAPPVDLFEPYDVDRLLADKTGSGHNIVATVLVEAHSNYRTDGPEAMRPVGETEYADRTAEAGLARGGRAAGVCAGIVAHADLLLGASVGAVLDAHLAASKRVRGIRHGAACDPEIPAPWSGGESGIMGRRGFREGFAELAKRGLSFDAWVFQSQLREVTDLSRGFPDTTIILDHLGAPAGVGGYAGRRAEAFAQWKADLAEVAKSPNVVMKVGGLNMGFTGITPKEGAPPYDSETAARVQRDHILTAIDLFGPDRCMFESNFPVDMHFTSYTVLWNGFKRVSAHFTPDERAHLFERTAKRVYRID